jgi:RimJ/RimL family protein N-acetyltransferase
MATPQSQPTDQDDQDDFYLGPKISTQPSPLPSRDLLTSGKYATLQGLSKTDIPTLWKNLGTPEGDTSVFNYIPQLRQPTPEAFREVLHSLRDEHGIVLYAIKADRNNLPPWSSSSSSSTSPPGPSVSHTEPLGLIAFLDIQPNHRALEIGAVLYSPALQRSTAATEAQYLLLRYAFGDDPTPSSLTSSSTPTPALSPPYRRVVWKCNALNKTSRRAAERLGFVYEGTLRNNVIQFERSRDSEVSSMLEGEWAGFVRAGFEAWLDGGNFGEGGRQVLGLGEVREREREREKMWRKAE